MDSSANAASRWLKSFAALSDFVERLRETIPIAARLVFFFALRDKRKRCLAMVWQVVQRHNFVQGCDERVIAGPAE